MLQISIIGKSLLVLAITVVTLLILLVWHLFACLTPDDDIPIIFLPDTDSGDVLLFRHKKYEAVPFLNTRIVSHVAMVWKTEMGSMVVDINPSAFGPYTNARHIVIRGKSLVVYPLEFAVRNYPGTIFLRRLRSPMTPTQRCNLSDAIRWAIPLRYDDTIASRDIVTYISIALSTLLPQFSFHVAEISALSVCRTSIFCTELVSELLRRSGVLPTSASHVYGPISWMSRLQDGTMSRLWSAEVQIIWDTRSNK